MKTKKSKFLKILSILLICCISFLCVGCMGSTPEENDELESELGKGDDFGESMIYPMYGTRVLYRPDSYDYDAGSGAEAGKTNDYYGNYAYAILRDIYQTYGIVVPETAKKHTEIPESNADKLSYLYDSIRYKVDTFGTVTHSKTQGSTTEEQLSTPYIIVGADTSTAWNWTFDYQYSELPALLTTLSLTKNDHLYSSFDDVESFKNEISMLYHDADYSNLYSEAILGSESNYSDYVKALEYVIYSYALDLEPMEITVKIEPTATKVEDLYSVKVKSFDSVDAALADVKALFNKIGSYVGLIERQIAKISNWIKTNVIGEKAMANDYFDSYGKVVQIVNNSGDVVDYEFSVADSTLDQPLGRNYSVAVDNIVKAACEYVSIGKESDDSDVTIDERFLASEMKEYAGETFFIHDDANFPAPGTSNSKTAIEPLEYQSIQFMLKEGADLSDLWIALKYDADLDGTEEGVFNPDKYLDMIVELNYYSYDLKKMFVLGSQQARVYDGGYVFGQDIEINGQKVENHGMVIFKDFAKNCTDPAFAGISVGGGVHVGPFNPDIGGGILKTDVGKSGYNGSPMVSENPLVIVGTTDVRKYYSIIEPEEGELGENQFYITGRANSEMYGESDGSDYLEVTYKVLKQRGDTTTNYKFYTGIAMWWDAVNIAR